MWLTGIVEFGVDFFDMLFDIVDLQVVILCLDALLVDNLSVFNEFSLNGFHRQVQRFYDQLESLWQFYPLLITFSVF